MADQKSVETELLEAVTCPVCLEVYTDPAILQCFHTFCRNCLKEHVKASNRTSNEGKTTFNCPSCRKQLSLGTDGLQSAPSNFFMNSLIDTFRSQVATTSESCGMCDIEGIAEDPKWRCLDCDVFMCEACKQAHDRMRRMTQNHSVLSMAEWHNTGRKVVRKANVETCTKHINEELKFYCDACKLPICRDCHITRHADHKCRDLTDVAVKIKDALRGKMDDLRSGIHKIDDTTQELQLTQVRLLKAEKESLQDIETVKSMALSVLTQFYEELKQKFVEHYSCSRKNLEKAIDSTTTEKASLQSACDHGDHVIRYGGIAAAVDTLNSLSKVNIDIKQITDNVSIKEMDLVKRDLNVLKSDKLLGGVEEHQIYPQGHLPQEPKKPITRARSAQFNVNSPNMFGFGSPTSNQKFIFGGTDASPFIQPQVFAASVQNSVFVKRGDGNY